MAETVDQWEFSRLGSNRGSRYDQFLDGQIWKLTLEDSWDSGTIETFRTTLQGAARRKDLRSRTQVVRTFDKDGNVLTEALMFQAIPDDDSGNGSNA